MPPSARLPPHREKVRVGSICDARAVDDMTNTNILVSSRLIILAAVVVVLIVGAVLLVLLVRDR